MDADDSGDRLNHVAGRLWRETEFAHCRPVEPRREWWPLVCAECGSVSADGEGWQARVADEGEVVAHCPPCAAREFGSG
jgi:hypothetical protein